MWTEKRMCPILALESRVRQWFQIKEKRIQKRSLRGNTQRNKRKAGSVGASRRRQCPLYTLLLSQHGDGTPSGWAGDLAKAAAVGTQEEEEVEMLVLTAVSKAFALKVCRKWSRSWCWIKRGELYYLSMFFLFVHFKIGNTILQIGMIWYRQKKGSRWLRREQLQKKMDENQNNLRLLKNICIPLIY